jgi:chemotaxis protein methyltransferase CheR
LSLQILLISDNGSFTEYLSCVIGSAGHTVVTAQEGSAPYRAVGKHKPDLVIVSVEAAKVANCAVEQRLHTEKGPRPVPVIVVSECLRLEAELLHLFDFIPKPLDPARLMDDIAAIARRAPAAGEPAQPTERQYRDFSAHILSCAGLQFESRNRSALERGVRKRMYALLMTCCDEYLGYLREHGESRHELQKLLQFLTVGETYFFRYPSHFEAVKQRLRLSGAAPGEPIRIWSAGCSTGEEPYSIAISVMETLPDWRDRDIRIIATDINNHSLKSARQGVYTPWSIRGADPALIARYFRRIGESYVIRDEVKSLVDFRHLNLACSDAFLFPPAQLDAIFCRNVLIYLSLETATALVERFADALKPSGKLFLGHAETVLQRCRKLEVRRQQNCFYYVRRPEERESDPAPPPAPAPALVLAPAPEPDGRRDAPPLPCRPAPPPAAADRLQAARELYDAEELDGALKLVEEVLAETPREAAALILKGFVLAAQGRVTEALHSCSDAIALNDLLPEAYFLKGILLDACDLLGEAADEYRKALLLDHDFIMPRYYMGRLHLRLGRVAEGAREIRNSIKLLSRRGGDETIPYSGGLTRSVCMLQLQSTLAQVA